MKKILDEFTDLNVSASRKADLRLRRDNPEEYKKRRRKTQLAYMTRLREKNPDKYLADRRRYMQHAYRNKKQII